MKNLIMVIAMVTLFSSIGRGDSVRTWNGDDGAPVFRVKNTGTETVTITVPSGAAYVYVTNGTVGTTITVGDAGTVASVVASIEATTNSSGDRPLTIDAMCSLAADVFSNKVVASTITIQGNNHAFVNGPKWDSSGALHFDTYYPKLSSGGVGDQKTVTHIFGDVAGTGNITLVGYVDRVEVFQKTIVSPVYVWGQISSTTNTNTADSVTPGVFDINIDIPIARDESLLVRATRATTATDSGGIGMVLDLKD